MCSKRDCGHDCKKGIRKANYLFPSNNFLIGNGLLELTTDDFHFLLGGLMSVY